MYGYRSVNGGPGDYLHTLSAAVLARLLVQP